jgi:hypothetical protein
MISVYFILFQIVWFIPKNLQIYLKILNLFENSEFICKCAHLVLHCCTLPHCRTLPRALSHTAACTAAHCHVHCSIQLRTQPRTLPRTLPHCQTVAHCRAHCHILLRTLPDKAWIQMPHVHCTLHSAQRTQLHTAFNMNWNNFIWMYTHLHEFIWILCEFIQVYMKLYESKQFYFNVHEFAWIFSPDFFF